VLGAETSALIGAAANVVVLACVVTSLTVELGKRAGAEVSWQAGVQQSILPWSAPLRGISLPMEHAGMVPADAAASAAIGVNANPSAQSSAMTNLITRVRIGSKAYLSMNTADVSEYPISTHSGP
jgi:hypothetical protein